MSFASCRERCESKHKQRLGRMWLPSSRLALCGGIHSATGRERARQDEGVLCACAVSHLADFLLR